MSAGALTFMIISWTFVLGLVTWCFARILSGKRHFDPDGIGPAVPPEPGRFDAGSGGGRPPR